MKKKILFVIDSLNSGGAEKSLISLLSLLDYDKYEVDLLTFRSGGLYEPLIHESVNRLKSPDIFTTMSKSIKEVLINKEYSNFFWRIKSSIDIRYKMRFTHIKHGAQAMWPNLKNKIQSLNKEYDVAVAYSQGTPTYYVAEKVEAVKKICWINTDYIKAGYNIEFDKKYYNNYNNIVTVSNKNKEILEKVFPKYKTKIKVIYDSISPKLVINMAKEDKGYNDDFDGIRILTIGRHVHLKGYDIAIDAARILKEKGIKFRWYSIGEGVLTSRLKQQVKENNLEDEFKFRGTYTNPYPFISGCDIYCQPSRFEGFGMAIAEAKILKKPVIVTNFEIASEQIKDEENGLIVEMNSQSISTAIIRLMDDIFKEKIVSNLKNEKVGIEEEINKINKILYE